MDEKTQPDSKTPLYQYKPLGARTLYMLIIKRSPFALVFLLLLIGAFLFARFVPYEYTGILANVVLTIVVVLIVSAIITFYLGWLEYIHYGVFIEENSFRITRGLFAEEEIGVSYRFIQEIRLERSLVDQALGISHITILVLGEAQGLPFPEVSKLRLPYLSKNIASEIQEHILNRSSAKKTAVI